MAEVKLSVAEQLRQLDDARKLVLRDVSYYPAITRSVLAILNPNSPVEMRRWGAEFLAEAFSSPVVSRQEKEGLCVEVLELLRTIVENTAEDVYVLRSVVQVVASVYPLALKWVINNSWDGETWKRLVAIKSRILRIWDDAPPSLRLGCIKFAQRVVLAQTTAVDMIQMRDGLEISLKTIPPGHTLLEPRDLEAEATGLLDRMLGVLQDNSSEALVVDATINTLSILIRTRPSTSNRILNAVLAFNPLKLANSPMTPKNKMYIKSMEKTTRMLLLHLFKRDPQNPLAPRIQQHIERLMRSKTEALEQAGQKRPLPGQEAEAQADPKRQKVVVVAPPVQPHPLAPGPNSLAALFTVTSNPGLAAFDASQIPAGLVARISVGTLASLPSEALDSVVNTVRTRLAERYAAQPAVLNAETSPLGVEDDDDDYEPDYYGSTEDAEQILNRLDSSPSENPPQRLEDATLALGPWNLPPPPQLSPDMAAAAGQGTVIRVFDSIRTLEDPVTRPPKAGINRLAASAYDRDSWLTVIMRLATRASAGLDDISVKDESSESTALATIIGQTPASQSVLSAAIRDLLYNYILEDFRKRIEVAVSWLCEEWYNDQLSKRRSTDAPLHYDKVAIKLVDGFFPYLNPQDKVLTRFLGEIPELNVAIMARVKNLCGDPSMVQLALTSLLYLVMLKPPAKGLALDAVEGIWVEYEDARPMAAKYLAKFRPGFLETQKKLAEEQKQHEQQQQQSTLGIGTAHVIAT